LFAFYDFETTGTSPQFDQPLQFAAILTDGDFQEVERVNIRAKLDPYVLPAPWALAVTGVTPQQLNDPNLPSAFDFSRQLADLIKRWGPCVWIGYNTIKFDEEFFRQAFYQNLHPSPYLTQMNGNERMDLMKIIWAVRAKAPSIFTWPENDKGKPSFKLDQLAPANGFTQHDAHDALGDVEATIHMADLIRYRAPEIWDQAYSNRSKHMISRLLKSGQPVELIERFGGGEPKSMIGTYLGQSKTNSNEFAFVDIDQVTAEELASGSYEAIEDAVTRSTKGTRSVAINKHEALYPVEAPSPDLVERTRAFAKMVHIRPIVGEVLADKYADRDEPEHVEQQLYSGFANHDDPRRLHRLHTTDWFDASEEIQQLTDPRLRTLGQRLLHKYAPGLLSNEENTRIATELRRRWDAEGSQPWMTFEKVESQLAELEEQRVVDPDSLTELRIFYNHIANRG